MNAHAKLSPSSMARWSRCPGSVALCEGLPNDETIYSATGTVAHEIAAACLRGNIGAQEYRGHLFEHGGYEIVADDEMINAVSAYVDFIRPRTVGADLVLIEQKLDLSNVYGQKNQLGTGDCILLRGKTLEVHDYKHGKGVAVSAEDNDQMFSYAAGAVEVVEQIVGAGVIKTIEMSIHQPRVRSEPDVAVVSRAELEKFVERARPAAAVALSGNGPLNPGEKQCRWCSAKATCPALRDEVLSTVSGQFDNLDDVKPAPLSGDVEILGKLFDKIPLIEGWCRAVIGKIEELAFAGQHVPGVKVIRGREGNRAWGDEAAAEDVLKRARFTQEQMYSFKLLSPTKISELLNEHPKVWARVETLITRAEGRLQVVGVDDRRPAVDVQPVADSFDKLD